MISAKKSPLIHASLVKIIGKLQAINLPRWIFEEVVDVD
jgi:hypothetical protein